MNSVFCNLSYCKPVYSNHWITVFVACHTACNAKWTLMRSPSSFVSLDPLSSWFLFRDDAGLHATFWLHERPHIDGFGRLILWKEGSLLSRWEDLVLFPERCMLLFQMTAEVVGPPRGRVVLRVRCPLPLSIVSLRFTIFTTEALAEHTNCARNCLCV